MEVVDKNVAMLSNYEVYDFLVKCEKNQSKKNNRSQNLATISYETKEYLSQTPCVTQSEEVIKKVLLTLSKYSLTKAEKLQLLNLRPTLPVAIQGIIEELEERFNDSEMEDILKIINELIPPVEINDEMES